MSRVSAEPLRWDDVRIFLATFRAGSLRAAAADLGVSRPTAARRLTALEGRLGLKLFERRPDGLHATPEAVGLVDAAEQAERAMLGVERAAAAVDPGLRGPVRVSMPPVASAELLMPDLVAFCRAWPEIELHLAGSYDTTNLAQREADVAIRFMPCGKAPDADLAGRMVATAYVAAYGEGDFWIGQRGPKFDSAWVRQTDFPDLPVRGTIADGETQRSACAAGLGMAWLPCFFAEPTLTRRSEPKPGFDIWVLVHPDMRRNPRNRLFRDAMVLALRRLQPRLEGRV
jgi:DNA-binding transcriptional LysR family regulator